MRLLELYYEVSMHDLFYSSIYLIADINILIKRSVHTCTYNLCKYTMTSKIIPTKSKSNNIRIIHYFKSYPKMELLRLRLPAKTTFRYLRVFDGFVNFTHIQDYQRHLTYKTNSLHILACFSIVHITNTKQSL